MTQESYTGNQKLNIHDTPELYNLEVDPGEQWNVADAHPEVIRELTAAARTHTQTVRPVPSQLEIPIRQ